MRSGSVVFALVASVLMVPVVGADSHFTVFVTPLGSPVVPLSAPGVMPAKVIFQCSAMHATPDGPVEIELAAQSISPGLTVAISPQTLMVAADECLVNPVTLNATITVAVDGTVQAYQPLSFTLTGTVPTLDGEADAASDDAAVTPGFLNLMDWSATNTSVMLGGVDEVQVEAIVRNLGNGPAHIEFTLADVDPSILVDPIPPATLGASVDAPGDVETIIMTIKPGPGSRPLDGPARFTVTAHSSDGTRPSDSSVTASITFDVHRPTLDPDEGSGIPGPGPSALATALTLAALMVRRR